MDIKLWPDTVYIKRNIITYYKETQEEYCAMSDFPVSTCLRAYLTYDFVRKPTNTQNLQIKNCLS